MCLADLVKRNNRIQYVGLRQTSVALAESEAIFAQTRHNAARQFVLRGTPSNPSGHPAAIRLRAMKRFFFDMSHGSGKVDSAVAVREGVRERQRVLGKSRELALYKEAYYESLLLKAPSKMMNWDTFVVLVLMQCSEYLDDIISALHRVFSEFQVGSDRTQELGDAQVEVRCYASIYVRLYHALPSDQTLAFLKKRLDLEDDMTVNWDDFLFCFYNAGPSVKGALLGVGDTPAPLHSGVNHF
ncbi:hypothetical protein STCU_06084 [Strigomonas culicis]|uniref:Uncharacterized protein n=1 Tax=Strigomonas culicis TaxID=28005 RepID=S9U7Q3_9TRYP|nr:hypothetical protein STCU_06084 [Strigomonas culicis]|eukprot:EPY26777.1 hypothetical protein STCU_06084 [Strigomonas culicis]